MRFNWPKLSETATPASSLRICQFCGSDELVRVWLECDERDVPTNVGIVCCKACVKKVIKPHKRLYKQMEDNRPLPGMMDDCELCMHRSGTTCKSAALKANGGPGLEVLTCKPDSVFICPGGHVYMYRTIPRCKGRQLPLGAEDYVLD